MKERFITFPNGEQICPLGQGTWQMGKRCNEEIQALQRGIDLGMTLIDTAEMYDNEDLVGKAIHECRTKVFLVSKVLPNNANYKGTKSACERSLSKLKTDYIDLYLLHWKGCYPFSETVRAMVELKKEGKIHHWGMSNLNITDMNYIMSLPHGKDCAANQVLYNLKERGIEYDLLPWSEQHKMPVMAYTPLGEGQFRTNKILVEVARKHEVTPTQIALAWIIRNPNIIAIPKTSNIFHVEENFHSLDIQLTNEDLQKIDTAFPAPMQKVPLVGW